MANADYGIPDGMSMKKLDKLVARFYKIIETSLDKACPKITISPRVKTSHWATEEHSNLKIMVSKLYKTAKKSGTHADWIAYREADKDFKRKCNRDKNRAWRKYKECMQSTKDVTTLTKLAQRQDRREINVLTKADGTTTCLLYTSPSPRDRQKSRMPSSA